MKGFNIFIALVLVVVSAACSAGAETVEVPVEVTRVVEVSVEVTRVVEVPVEVTRLVEVPVEVTRVLELVVTATPRPTPEPTATSERSMEEIQADVAASTASALESFDLVERVNVVRFSEGRVDVELYTVMSARDNQPDVSWTIVTELAEVYADLGPGQRMNLTGSEDFVFALTTFSTDGDYRYQSETNFETFVNLNNRAMTYDEWVAAANAGFR